MSEFAILIEFEDNRKNSNLLRRLESSVGKKYTIRQTGDKYLIKEVLFDALQMEIECVDIDFISLVQIDGSKMQHIIKEAELWSEEYDRILRKLRFDRVFV